MISNVKYSLNLCVYMEFACVLFFPARGRSPQVDNRRGQTRRGGVTFVFVETLLFSLSSVIYIGTQDGMVDCI